MGCPMTEGGQFKPPPVVLMEKYSPLYKLSQMGPLRKICDAPLVLHIGAILVGVEAVHLLSLVCRRARRGRRTEKKDYGEESVTASSELEKCETYWTVLEDTLDSAIPLAQPSPATPLDHIVMADCHDTDHSILFTNAATVLVPVTPSSCFWQKGQGKVSAVASLLTSTGVSAKELSPYGALLSLWQDTARYEVNVYEVRQLLTALHKHMLVKGQSTAVLSPHSRCALANLALVWFLTHLREIHCSLFYYNDTMRCEENVEELETHLHVLYKLCIKDTTTPDDTALIGCSPRHCWEVLRQYYGRLKHVRQQQSFSYIRVLLNYMYSSSRNKATSWIVLMFLTGVTARVASCASQSRAGISEALLSLMSSYKTALWGSGNRGCRESCTPTEVSYAPIVALCAFELFRLTLHGVLVNFTQTYIHHAASIRRDIVKVQLYEAMSHLPLTFYDLHNNDDVEEIVYYVNDIEGVDIHLHQYIFDLINSIATVRAAFITIASPKGCCLVIAATIASRSLKVLARATTRYYHLARQRWALFLNDEGDDDLHDSFALATGGEDIDLQEGENTDSNVNRDGIMLRGLEIITALPLLRPYGADVRLMHWWNRYQYGSRYTTDDDKPNEFSSMKRRDRATSSALLPASTDLLTLPSFGTALLTLSEFLLPIVVSSYGANINFRGGRSINVMASQLLEGSTAFSSFVTTALDAGRVYDVVVRNAYKSKVIETILSPHSWEEYERTAPSPVDLSDYTVSGVTVRGLQFRYPTAPTVPVFPDHLDISFPVRKENGDGLLVSIVGSSGSGKSTLLKLLLGLYDHPNLGDTLQLTVAPIDGSAGNPVAMNIGAIPRRVLREQLFSFVPQTPSIFPGATIAHNVCLQSRVSLTHTKVLAKVQACLREAKCDYVQRFPQGVLTQVTQAGDGSASGAGVVQLSGGQAQRLMLARALFLGGKVLLMDEMTSGLDKATKTEILAEWRQLLQSGRVKGIICATHDETVMAASDVQVSLSDL